MIDNAADYKFVTGITNGEVLINGHIMPWRDAYYSPDTSPATDNPKCLRGEDICFLYEGGSRKSLLYVNPRSYNPKISKAQLVTVASQVALSFNDAVMDGIQHQKTATFPKVYGTWVAGRNLVNLVYGQHAALSDYTGIQDLSLLKADTIRTLFDNFKKIKSAVVDTRIVSGPTPSETSRAYNGSPRTIPSYTPGIYTIIEEQCYVSTSGAAVARRYDNAEGVMILELDPFSSHQLNLEDFGGECVSAIVGVYVHEALGTYYDASIQDRMIMATVDAIYQDGRIAVSLSSIHSLADQLADRHDIYSRFYTSGRSDWPDTVKGSGSLSMFCSVYGIVTWPDIDITSI